MLLPVAAQILLSGLNEGKKAIPPMSVGFDKTRSLAAGRVVYHPSLLFTKPIKDVVPEPEDKVVTPVTPVT